jgi:hypothetical protein
MKHRKPALPQDPLPPQPAPGRYFHLTYSNAAPDEEPKLFQCRDGLAFNELTAALPAGSYQYGTTIHFYPDHERQLREFPKFQPEDLLVLTTRPPLTDRESLIPPRKIIRNSKNDLEKLVFKQLFNYFSYCTRKHVKLTPDAQQFLLANVRKWESLEFFEHSGAKHPCGEAHILRHMTTASRPESSLRSTVAFLVRVNNLASVEETAAIPCGLLASFGMDGYSTLIWNRIVRLQHPQWLTTPGFVMAELIFKRPIPRRPLTPEFATDPDFIDVKILTKTPGN